MRPYITTTNNPHPAKPSHLYVKRDTMHPKAWVLVWMVPGEDTHVGTEGECSRVYNRTRGLAVAYGKRVYGETAKNWPC